KKILDTYVNTGRVRLAYLNMPLSIHPNAVPAAEAAMCASVQNKFWPMHEALFATQKDWESLPKPDSAFEALASKQNLDMAAWRTCFNEHLTIPLIQADHDRAVAAHVNSTPTFFVGNQVMPGADADVPGAIEAALKAAGVSKKPPTD
ncbi:MAG TPA: thioredoxin domain-containing protein, partial [Gemmatimonadaceae bacterium]|nr:thioredoxin domain-containing protein [Gemmatimonadaceae bacterium]